jgi:HEPN domain-containing protein
MPAHERLADFVSAAPQRLADAEELLQMPSLRPNEADAGHRHLRGAVYLAGYAVECALKAYLIASVPGADTLSVAVESINSERQTRGEEPLDLSGRRGHDIRALLSATDLAGSVSASRQLRQSFDVCTKWTTDWRYDPRPFTARKAANDRVSDARRVYEWVEARRTSAEQEGNE